MATCLHDNLEDVLVQISSPTNNPTLSPTQSPTISPTIPPTNSPSKTPTSPPTISPSIAPTIVPSVAPSTAPTRYPTDTNAYSKTLEAIYKINHITKENIKNITANNIIAILETSYVNVAPVYQTHLHYKDFMLVMDDAYIYSEGTLTLQSYINYEYDTVARTILFLSDKYEFMSQNKIAFRKHFKNKNITFSLFYIDSLNISSPKTSFNYVLYSLLSFIFIMGLISLTALMFNKKQNSKIDNADWLIAILFGLQVFDFFSDINLSIEMISKWSGSELESTNALLYISSIGCITFIIMPWITNLIIATNIKKFVSGNNAAASYFEHNAPLFVMLVVFTGASYPSLALLSSRLFGLDILNSGITKFELRQLSKIKIFGSVLLENIPQLFFQMLYIIYLEGTPSNNTLLSFIASTLSIIAALLSWFIQSTSSKYVVIQYNLEMKKTGEAILLANEKQQILQNKERKNSFKNALCHSLNISENQMELGFVTVTSTGFKMHVIQYIFTNEFNTDNGNIKYVKSAKKLYRKNNEKVKTAFMDHFHFDFADFNVTFMDHFHYLIDIQSAQNVHFDNTTDTDIMNLMQDMMELFHKKKSKNAIKNDLIKKGHHKELVVHYMAVFNEFKDKKRDDNQHMVESDDDSEHNALLHIS
eukprot:372232_1